MERKIRWDLFKAKSGKWGYGGEAKVSADLWNDGYIPQIIESQIEVNNSCFSGDWILVTTDNPNNPTGTFDSHLFSTEKLHAGYEAWKRMKFLN